MIFPRAISKYLFKLFGSYFVLISIIFIGIFIISNAFDVLQKFRFIQLSSNYFWKLTFYKIPYLISEVSPFISFITMMVFLGRLARYNELIIILSSGISYWYILTTAVVLTGLIGILIIGIINPIGSYGLGKYSQLEEKLTKKRHNDFAIIKSGILIFEEYENENRIIKASSINLSTGEMKNVTILFINDDNLFLKRLDAKTGLLKDDNIILKDLLNPFHDTVLQKHNMQLPTKLSVLNVSQNFILPEVISIWDLKSSITKFAKSGIPVINYQIYYYKLLMRPLLMMASVMLASSLISSIKQRVSQSRILLVALILGFIVYSCIEVFSRILVFNGLAPMGAILFPILLLMFLSNLVILHFQEA